MWMEEAHPINILANITEQGGKYFWNLDPNLSVRWFNLLAFSTFFGGKSAIGYLTLNAILIIINILT